MSRSHSHTGQHHHAHSLPDNSIAFAVGIALNLGFVIAEVAYGLRSHSLALISDAGHNLGDVFGLLMAFGAVYLGKSLPTKHRTYGLRRSSILAALSSAILLLIVVGSIASEAIRRIGHPEPIAGNVVIWVAAVGVLINTVSALLFAAGRRHDINIRATFVHMVVDAAVSLGVVITGFAIQATGWYWLDPAVSLLIGVVIVWGTWQLLLESFNLAVDAVPAGIDPHAVEAYLGGLPGVKSIHDLHIWAMSTTEVALTVHLVMPQPPSNDRFLHEVGHMLLARFRIGHFTVQFEYGDDDVVCHQEPANVV